MFTEFFRGFIPVSFHSHVSDASNPATILSLLLYVAGTSIFLALDSDLPSQPVSTAIKENIKKYYGWTDLHIKAPRFAVVRGVYGAAYGHLVSYTYFSLSVKLL